MTRTSLRTVSACRNFRLETTASGGPCQGLRLIAKKWEKTIMANAFAAPHRPGLALVLLAVAFAGPVSAEDTPAPQETPAVAMPSGQKAGQGARGGAAAV